ncbi:MAG: sugar phosphate nucleotidyltransferase [Chloroflexota bacterium]
MINHAVILAVGNPSHQSQLTYNRTLAMLPALGKPLFIRIMERLYRVGIRDYTVIVGENEGAVASYLNSQWMPDVTINLIIHFSGHNLLKPFRSIAESLKAPFLVTTYNSFTHTHFPSRLIKTHESHPDALIFGGAPVSLSQANQQRFAVVKERRVTDVSRTRDGDRQTYTLADLYVCGSGAVEFLRGSQDDDFNAPTFADVARAYLKADGQGIIAESTWILQVETDRDLLTLNRHLLDEGQDAHILSELPYTVKIIPPVRIDPQVTVGQGCKIGPHVYLERGCTVGHDVTIQDSIVMARANVPAQKTLVNTILTTRGPIT